MNVPDSVLLQRIDPNDRKLTCKRCKSVGQPRLTEAGPHIKAECNNCGAYIKFVKQLAVPLDNCPDCGGMNYLPGVPHCTPAEDKPYKDVHPDWTKKRPPWE